MNKRVVVAVGALFVVVGMGAGAYVVFSEEQGPPAVGQVPDDVDAVVHVDGAVTNDGASRTLANTGLERASLIEGVPNSTADVLSEFEGRTGLDPDAADEIVAFSRRTNGSTELTYAGVIVHGNWDRAAVIEAVRNDTDRELTETTYNGQTVYRPAGDGDAATGQWIGVLGEGQYVFGTEAAVKETIDVTAGDGEGFGGRLQTGHENARDGLVTFAVRVPTDRIPEQVGAGPGIELTRYRQVAIVSGSYYSKTNGAGVELRLLANSTEAAQDVEDVTSGALATFKLTTGNESVEQNVDAIEVERDGTSVIISYEESIESIQALLRHYQQRSIGGQSAIQATELAEVSGT